MATHCSDCCTPTEAPRRGLCPSCYRERYLDNDMPYDAACIHCGERRPACLKWLRAGAERAVVCHNCEALISRMQPRPRGLADLLAKLRREVWPEEWREASNVGVIVHRPFEEFNVGPHELELAEALMALEEA